MPPPVPRHIPCGLDPKTPAYYARQLGRLGRLAARGAWLTARQRADFRSVASFALFIGYPRSGHSVIGSLLDAHPDMVFAHELDALQLTFARFPRALLYHLILDNSRRFSAAGRRSPFYSYAVPTQWQGRCRTLRVIGDKHGEATTLRLHTDPGLLARLQATVGVPVKIIHVIRNPFDNIATIAHRLRLTPAAAADYYFRLAAMVAAARRDVPGDHWLDVRHEHLIADPTTVLAQLCRFLGVEPTPDYLADCAAVVFPTARHTSRETGWEAAFITQVTNRFDQFPWLPGYDPAT